mmetsp:Transcript_39134/g.96324  ORF Transcript_39134/g.96324 Transcript_39134/m.96324 type:complete len:350 (+) Transcript_39134:42-1091(+)
MGRNDSVSAKAALAAQLNELMGKERDVPVDKRENRKMHYYDDEVDKHWLCGLSPYVALRHTKSDLGAWDKLQDEDAKAEWDALPQEKKDECGYEYELYKFLDQLITNLDRAIKRQKDKITADTNARRVTLSKDTLAQVDGLAKQIADMQTRAQTLGEEGNIDESMAMLKEAEELKKQKDALENPVAEGKEKRLEVCDICCNLMSEGDKKAETLAAQQRMQEHLTGKQHVAWDKIRTKYEELRAMRNGRGPPPPTAKGAPSRSERSKERDQGKDRGGDRDMPRRDRSRERERERPRSRDRDRSRSRDKDSYRERRRDRSRSRERSYRDDRRDRDRSRDRDRRDYRSRDRD